MYNVTSEQGHSSVESIENNDDDNGVGSSEYNNMIVLHPPSSCFSIPAPALHRRSPHLAILQEGSRKSDDDNGVGISTSQYNTMTPSSTLLLLLPSTVAHLIVALTLSLAPPTSHIHRHIRTFLLHPSSRT